MREYFSFLLRLLGQIQGNDVFDFDDLPEESEIAGSEKPVDVPLAKQSSGDAFDFDNLPDEDRDAYIMAHPHWFP